MEINENLPKCNIQYRQRIKDYDKNIVLKINELLKNEEMADIICYAYDMGYDDGMADVVDSMYRVGGEEMILNGTDIFTETMAFKIAMFLREADGYENTTGNVVFKLEDDYLDIDKIRVDEEGDIVFDLKY